MSRYDAGTKGRVNAESAYLTSFRCCLRWDLKYKYLVQRKTHDMQGILPDRLDMDEVLIPVSALSFIVLMAR